MAASPAFNDAGKDKKKEPPKPTQPAKPTPTVCPMPVKPAKPQPRPTDPCPGCGMG